MTKSSALWEGETRISRLPVCSERARCNQTGSAGARRHPPRSVSLARNVFADFYIDQWERRARLAVTTLEQY